MDDWGTPEEMAAEDWRTGRYLDRAGYQNPNDRMNRGELPKTYNAEMDLNDRAYKAYVDWVRNNSEGRAFANSQGSPMYTQRIDNTPKPTTKLGPIELPPRMTITELGTEILPELPNNNPSALRAPNLYSSLGYTYPEFVEEYYGNNGGIDTRPWEDEKYYGYGGYDAEMPLSEELEGIYGKLPKNDKHNVKTWEEKNRDFIDRFERQENLELPTTHFEDSRIQPQRLYDAERANRLNDSYRKYMNGQRNGRIESNGLLNDWVPSKDVNGASNWKFNDAYDIRDAMKPYGYSQDGEVFSTNWRPNYEGRISSIKSRLDNNKRIDTPEIKEIRKDFFGQPKDVYKNEPSPLSDDNWIDTVKPADASKVQEIRKDFFGKQSPKSSATIDSIVDEYAKGDWRNNPIVDNFEDFSAEEEIGTKAGEFSEAELNEMADNLRKQTTQKAPKKNQRTDLVDEYYEGEMPKQIERSFEKANYKQNKIDNTKKLVDEFNAQRAGAKPYGNPYSKEGMRYQNGSGQRAPYFNASAFGTFAPAAHAVNFAYQHPTQATIATGLGLTGIAATNLVHNGMDAAMAYEAASQMIADAQAKYQDFIANGYGEEAAAYFSGLADLIAQQRAEQGID